jgi:MFS family permease
MKTTTVSNSQAWIGRYLGLLQFLLVLGWTVYAAFVPELLARVGIGKDKAGWLLMADQLLFMVFDVGAGFLADRAFVSYARLGPWLVGISLLSCLAFLLLPEAAALGQPLLLMGLIGLWAATSSALRAPAFALLARHLPPSASSRAATGLLLGMALAGIVSPYLGTALKGISPTLPFAVSSLSLFAVASGLIVAERRLAVSASFTFSARPALTPAFFYPVLLLAALAFQICFNLNAAPRYLLSTTAGQLPWLMPVFWIGFNIGPLVSGVMADKAPARLLQAGSLIACAGLFIGIVVLPPSLNGALLSQFLSGLGWGLCLAGAFGFVTQPGLPLKMATATGLLYAVLALATLIRIALGLAGYGQWLPQHASGFLLPFNLWLLTACLLVAGRVRRKAA